MLTYAGAASWSISDTKIYVYDVEADVFLSYDCGPTHWPVSHAWDHADDRLLAVEVPHIMCVCVCVYIYTYIHVCVCVWGWGWGWGDMYM